MSTRGLKDHVFSYEINIKSRYHHITDGILTAEDSLLQWTAYFIFLLENTVGM